MKKIILSISILAMAVTTQAQKLDRSIRPKAGPAPEIKIADAQSFTLDNGMKVFVVENNKLPRVTASIQFDIDPVLEGNMTGYKSLIGDMMSAGTTTRSKDEFNRQVDLLGATMGASEGGAYASGLKRHQDKMFELLSDMVLNPAFPADELDKLKKQTLSGLQANKEDANAIASNLSAIANYGKNHPYGEVMTETSVNNITLDAFKKYHSTYYRPNVAYMAIVGDIKFEEAKTLANKYFGKWQKANVPAGNYATPKAPAKNMVYLANKTGAVQSVIDVTYPVELKPGTPDVIPVRLMNQIYGGGSTGRLFMNLREKHGWTYGSYSSISSDEVIGNVSANAQARTPVTDSSITEILSEMKTLRSTKVSNEELQAQKNLMSGTFAMGLENPQTIAAYAIAIERYGLPKDYYKNYLKKVAAVSVDDIQRVATKYLMPQNANIVVVGNRDEVEEKLKAFGPVQVMDMYGNPVVDKPKTAAPSGVTAETIYDNYIKAIGGEKAIKALKDLRIVREAEMQGQKLQMIQAQKAPDKFFQTFGMGSMIIQKMVVNGKTAYQEAQGQKQILEGAELEDALQESDLQAELKADTYGIKRVLKNQEGDYYVVEVTNKAGEKSTEYYDVKSGLLVKEISNQEGPQGPMSVTTEYLDYQEVPGGNGYKIPYLVKVPIGPGMFLDAKVTEVSVNKGLEDSLFQ